MNWKKWPYWAKGIGVSLIVFVVLFALAYYLNENRNAPEWFNYVTLFFSGIPLLIATYLVVPLFCMSHGPFDCLIQGLITAVILTVIEFSLVGAVLGTLYGKRKAQKGEDIPLS